MSVWCECWRRSRPRCAPPLAGSRGRPGLRAPCGQAEHMVMEETGWGWNSAGSRTSRAVRSWLEDWLVVDRAHMLACSLGRSVGSGRLRGSDVPGRACLARLGSACDCVCLEYVCVCGSVPFESDRLQSTRLLVCYPAVTCFFGPCPRVAQAEGEGGG